MRTKGTSSSEATRLQGAVDVAAALLDDGVNTIAGMHSAARRARTRHAQFSFENGRHFAPMNHFDLLNHPDVYDQMRQWLERPRPTRSAVTKEGQ